MSALWQERGDDELRRLERRLLADAARAIWDFSLIAPGDRVMVAVSGGKDSYGLLHLLMQLRPGWRDEFELVAVNLDQGQPGYAVHRLERHLERVGVAHEMLREDTYSIARGKVAAGEGACWLCARLRRGILYNAAVRLGCNRIALGHHRDDLIESLLLSALYAGELATMPPKLCADDGRNIIIRPLVYCREEDLSRLAELLEFPILSCGACGSSLDGRRQRVKRLLGELEAEHPGVKANLLHALGKVVPDHLLDRHLHDFGKVVGTEMTPATDAQSPA
jgi:tRNA 2-thiocytidine biosynthesis protein TtcA